MDQNLFNYTKTRIPERWIITAVSLAGLNALSAQILFLREFFILFRGSELAIGLILACWLIWTAVGSIISGKYLQQKTDPIKTWGIMYVMQIIWLPVTLLIISANQILSKSLPGELLSLEKMIIFVVFETAIFCIITGFLFSAGSHLYAVVNNSSSPSSSNKIYLYETLGAGIGGIFISGLILFHLSSMVIAVILVITNLFFLSCFYKHSYYPSYKRSFIIIFLCLLIVTSISLPLKKYIVTKAWKPMTIAAQASSKFGEWTVVKVEDEYTFYHNGIAAFVWPDKASAEENVHYALLQHPSPEKILMIGGGLNGGLSEVLKHPSVKTIYYVEADPVSMELIQHLKLPLVNDERIKFVHQDGRYFLKNSAEKYDIILCNMPDPDNAQINRFFTAEFFRLAKNHLNKNGLFSLKSEGAENFINQDHARYLASLYSTLKAEFNFIGILPGEIIHFFASLDSVNAFPDADTLVNEIRKRQIQTAYVREYYLPFRLMPDRTSMITEIFTGIDSPVINKDLYPKAYYLNNIYSGSKFLSPVSSFIQNWSKKMIIHALAILLIVIIILSFVVKPAHKAAGALSVFLMGFCVMGFEVALLIAFQSLFGYLYFEIALLTGILMLGMAAGNYAAIKCLGRSSIVLINLFLLCLSGLLIFFYILIQSDFILGWIGEYQSVGEFLFFLISFLCGSIGGFIFPMATNIYFGEEKIKKTNIGILYSIDLLGALLGSLLPAALLFPMIGMANFILFLVILNISVIITLGMRAKFS
ncbi:MAG: methyltransferase [Calditrichaceae bacterium]|nr:methyltransferase [Calditrichaceae bacterium]MBN2710471.1 methyltransferase [Calditrichaceae bacterium]RQV93595.1 MAG: hypothetical protein EH224_12025 [Calditrichota bacterium]